MVFLLGYLDVFLLHHLCTCSLEKTKEDVELMIDILTKYFSDFTAKQIEQFKALDNLYKEWNAKINVISRKDIDSLYEKHVLHSLAIAAVFDFPAGMEIVDIGTGGGFPGVPLAMHLLLVPIELFSTFILRPLTLALRLFANMFAGHVILLVFTLGGFVLIEASWAYAPISLLSWVMAILLTFFELMIAALQAYVFALLTASYVQGAIADEH